jgi:hypothetical protein
MILPCMATDGGCGYLILALDMTCVVLLCEFVDLRHMSSLIFLLQNEFSADIHFVSSEHSSLLCPNVLWRVSFEPRMMHRLNGFLI